MRILLFGNGKAGADSLETLAEMGHDILVVSPPGGRYRDWHESILERSQKLGIECIDPDDPNDDESLQYLSNFQPELILSILYHKILTQEILSLAEHSINFHPSLLPSYRGTAPLIWAIVNGEKETGVTAHQMTEAVDKGEYYARSFVSIDPNDTGFQLHDKVASQIPPLVSKVVRQVSDSTLSPIESLDLPESIHTSKTNYVNHLDPQNQTKKQIHNIVRALSPPLPPAWLDTPEGRMEVFSVDCEPSDSEEVIGGVNESVLFHDGSWYIRASDGIIRVIDFSTSQ